MTKRETSLASTVSARTVTTPYGAESTTKTPDESRNKPKGWKKWKRRLSHAMLGKKVMTSDKHKALPMSSSIQTPLTPLGGINERAISFSPVSNGNPNEWRDTFDEEDDESEAGRGHENKSASSPAEISLAQLIQGIPVELPLVRFVAEWFVDERSDHEALSVEWQVFFMCLRFHKWPLAQILAPRLERELLVPQHNVHSPHADPILAFLDECAA